MNKSKVISPFNNKVETGLRILCVLNESFPKSFDIQTLVYLDYLTVHSGDVNSQIESLHPPVPNRTGEIFVRRSIIKEGLDMLIGRKLIEEKFTKQGIEYKATETTTPFIEMLETKYFVKLHNNAKWVIANFSDMEADDLREFMKNNITKWSNEFNLEILD